MDGFICAAFVPEEGTMVYMSGLVNDSVDFCEMYQERGQKWLKQRTIAVLDAKGKNGGFDLVFTDAGIIPYKDRVLKPQVLYKDVHWKDSSQNELQIGEPYKGYIWKYKDEVNNI